MIYIFNSKRIISTTSDVKKDPVRPKSKEPEVFKGRGVMIGGSPPKKN